MAKKPTAKKSNKKLTSIKIEPERKGVDFATLLGLIMGIGLIALAVYIGSSKANFFNLPSVLIVIFGTIAVTSVSFSLDEMANAGKVIWTSFSSKIYNPSIMARQIMDIAVLTRKKGPLALSHIEDELKKDPYLLEAVKMVTDDYKPEDIKRIMDNETDTLAERHSRSSDILRRGAEIAPAMGLIGTLVGLIQMLSDLDDPNKIGPAMALALLTTFYGAILGTVILAPMAAKLERNTEDEIMIRNLLVTGMVSISKQDNPRRLEAVLNSILPPKDRIKYFD